MNTAGPARNEISVGGISTTIVSSVSELPDSLLRQSWRTASVALEPGHLVSSAADRRWLTTFVLARIGARPVGFLALLQRRTREFPDSIFDPADVAPGLFGTRGTSASQYLLIGGATELVSGTATAAEADARTARDIQSALVEAGFQAARDGGLTGAALYVRETELAAFLGPADSPRPHQATGDFAALRLPSGGMAGYLASLNHRHRSVVRRDLSRLEALGLYGREVAATDIAAEAAPLVLAVKRRHGVRDYQALVSYRLARWSAESFGERIAFAVRSPRDGRLLAVSFGCAHHRALELYEIGLADDSAARHLAYAETLIYAPLRYAARTGCTEIVLGLGSITPKRLRGAVVTKTWAVGDASSRVGESRHDSH